MSVDSFRVSCDACGAKSEQRGRDIGTQTPPGWLQGTVQLHDGANKEGPFWGHICPTCSALPIRDLIVRQAEYRAGLNARLA